MVKYPPITSAFLNVTNACNLACRYCFVEQHPHYMPFEVAKDAADFLKRNCTNIETPSITFFGGEPMLQWEQVVRPLIAYIRDQYGENYRLSMTTNGTLLTKDVIKYLKQSGVSVMISIDGNRDTQDYNRPKHGGASSFDDLCALLPAYIREYPDATFRSTLIPDSCHHLYENIRFAESIGYRNYFVIPNVFEPWVEEKKSVLADQMRALSDKYIADCSEGKQPMRFSVLDDSFQDIVRLNHACTTGCGNCTTAQNKCGLGQGPFASVDWKGRLFACQEMVSCKGEGDLFYVGDIYAGTDDARRSKLGQLFSVERLTGDGCENCLLKNVCDGGCVANNFMACGDVSKMPPVFCWWRRLVMQEAIYIMNVLGDTNHPGHLLFRNIWMELQQRKGYRCLTKMV